jgi:hypothetical protein
MESELTILDAKFEPLPVPKATGWVMRISGSARKIQHRALAFVARVESQPVEALSVNAAGDRFEGYLRRIPSPGDRLYVGYATADIKTQIAFRPEVGPVVA